MKKLTVLLVLLNLSCFSAAANELIDDLNQCKEVENALERLVCFDEVSKHLPSSKLLESKTETLKNQENSKSKPVKKVELIEDQTAQDFGIEHKQDISELPETLVAIVSSIKKDPYKKYIVSLDNGQIWKQTDSVYLRLKVGGKVLIKRGALNSFFMAKDGANKRIRVKRVK